MVLVSLGYSTKSFATAAPIVVIPCSNCYTFADLQGAAGQYFLAWLGKIPPGYVNAVEMSAVRLCSEGMQNDGTIVLVISSVEPVSDRFWFCEQHGTLTTFEIKAVDGGDNVSAITYDGLRFARSAKTQKIPLPTSLPVTETPEIISSYLSGSSGVPEVPGSQTINPWHAITNYPQLISARFYNVASGTYFTLWNGDTITVTDANGWTAKFAWTPLSTVQWALVPNSIRDQNGNVPAQGTSPAQNIDPAKLQPAAQLTITLPYDVEIYVVPATNILPQGVITVGDPDVGPALGGGTSGTIEILEIPN
jgi:hypothetical protein